MSSSATTPWTVRDAGASATDCLGLGTMEYVGDSDRKPDEMYDVTLKHLKKGFVHLDCAEMYESTPHVARAIADSGVPRDVLKITTKLKGLPCGDYAAVKERTQTHLKALGTDYADLLLIHWPGPSDANLADPAALGEAATWAYFSENIKSAWANMESLKKDGLAREIGVSNFYKQHLDELEKQVGAVPFANQLFIDATHHEADFVAYMQSKNIVVISYRPLIFFPVYTMAKDMGDNTIAVLEEANKSIQAQSLQQLVLSWLMRRGCHVITKASSDEHVQANVDAWKHVASSISPDALEELADGSEMAAMCGATDECADVFRAMSP